MALQWLYLTLLALVSISLCLADEDAEPAKHFSVVTIPDGDDVVQEPPGSEKPFSGPLVEFLDMLAALGNFTYDITANPDKNFGKRQKDGSWDGMIGSLLKEDFDIILDDVVMTPDRAKVLDGSELFVNATAYGMRNQNLNPNPNPDYVIKNDSMHFLLKHSTQPEAQKIWKNIQSRLPTSIVGSINEAVPQVEAGVIFLSDESTIDKFVKEIGFAFTKDPKPIVLGMPVHSYATKKGKDVGPFLNSILPSAIGAENVAAIQNMQ